MRDHIVGDADNTRMMIPSDDPKNGTQRGPHEWKPEPYDDKIGFYLPDFVADPEPVDRVH